MDWSSPLLIETGAGGQRVRPPRCTDAIGATLRDGYPVVRRVPDDMHRLLCRIDGVATAGRITARG